MRNRRDVVSGGVGRSFYGGRIESFRIESALEQINCIKSLHNQIILLLL
jgi:hypothetical protein